MATQHPDDPRVGDAVRLRLGRRDTIGKVVRSADAMGRLQVEVLHIGPRTTFTQHTRHLDDVSVVKRAGK